MGVKIETKDLTKVYRTGKTEVFALRGLNMLVEPGEVVAIMGPSGCGKTTLLNMLGGLDKPTAGSVLIDERNIVLANEAELERYRLLRVGFVFQFFNLISTLSALENIELPLTMAGKGSSERRERAQNLLSMVGLAEKAPHKPDELSGGEQQRVAIACALANDPPLLLADEPTGEIDTETAKRVIELLVHLNKELRKTVVIATHDTSMARNADRILRIEDGVIAGEYSPAQLREMVPTVETGYVQEVQQRLESLEAEARQLEADYRTGKVPTDDFIKRYESIQRTIGMLRDEVRRHGL